MDLIDLPALGNNFTCFNFVKNSMSIRDCFLISKGLIEGAMCGEHVNFKSLPYFDQSELCGSGTQTIQVLFCLDRTP